MGVVARGLFQGNITNNAINNNNSSTGPGMRIIANGCAAGSSNTMRVKVDGNTISNVANFGIQVLTRDGDATIDANITNNTVTTVTALAAEAIRMDAGATSTNVCGAADSGTINAHISGNNPTTDPVTTLSDLRVRQRFNTTYRLQGYGGSPTDNAAVQAFLAAQNLGAPIVASDFNNTGFQNIADVIDPVP